MIFCLVGGISATILGIDMGSSVTTVSIISPGEQIRLARNAVGKIENPTYFSFLDRDGDKVNWAFGDMAQEMCLKVPSSCVKGIAVGVHTHTSLKGYEVAALSLFQLVDSVKMGEDINESVSAVISVPPGFTIQQKTLLYAACSAVKLNVKGFVDTTEAIAYFYALERQNTFLDGPRIIAIVDIGGGSMSVSVFRFEMVESSPSYVQLAVNFDNIGGNTLDTDLMSRVAWEYGINLADPKRKEALLRHVSQAKEHLTVRDKYTFTLEEPAVQMTVDRAMLAECSERFNFTLTRIVRKTLTSVTESIDNVELVGSVTRIAFVSEILRREFGGVKLARSLNSETVVAIGTGYVGAALSSKYIVKHVRRRATVKHNCSVLIDDMSMPVFSATDTLDTLSTVQVKAVGTLEVALVCGGIQTLKVDVSVDVPVKINVSFIHSDFRTPVVTEITDIHGASYKYMRHPTSSDLTKAEFAKSKNLITALIAAHKGERAFHKSFSDLESYVFELKRYIRETTELSDMDTSDLRNAIAVGTEAMKLSESDRNATTLTLALAEARSIAHLIINK